MDPLVTTLRKLRRRLSVQQCVRFNVEVFLLSSTAACLWLLITRLFPIIGNPLPLCLALVGAGVVVATILGYLRRLNLVKTALEADSRLDLQERLTSSYELADAEGPMVEALHRDARKHVKGLPVQRHFPYRLPRAGRWLPIPLIVFGLAYMLLPEFDLLRHREREAEAKALKEATRVKAEKLQAAVRPLKKPVTEEVSQVAEITGAVERVAEKLKSSEISEKQALARVTNLSEELQKQREKLQKDTPMPRVAGDTQKLAMTREMANDIQNGRFGDAALKARELQKKLEEGGLTKREAEKLSEELHQLSEMLGGKENSELGQALAEVAQGLNMENMEAALEAMKSMGLSLEDIASVLEQLEQIDIAMVELSEWQQAQLGPSEYCRCCGVKLTPCGEGEGCMGGCGPGFSCYGLCAACGGAGCSGCGGGFCLVAMRRPWAPGEAREFGTGMGGPGRGRGARVGELSDVNATFKPTMLPGSLTKGKLLADIIQKGAPEEGAEATLEYVTGTFVAVRQEAEQALTKEEIPPGAKEFVRQYFGSIEPEQTRSQESTSSQD